jgi:Asp-tRNA(Asn)/Glu-tRNA(Gln) amidotransferase A subunit family amidase
LSSEQSAARIVADIGMGRRTAAQATEASLERIGAREAEVQAWAYLEPDTARGQARAIDACVDFGPLKGLPIGIKDIIDTVDMPTAFGSPIYAGHRPSADAACVAKLRAAGAVIIGKTVTTEFGAYHPGKTRNPHDLARTPGGSSSGSAAAVADGMVPVALGTQTAGSVIRPASFNGVVGYKATTGLIDHAGVKPFGPSFDALGVFARSVGDVRLVADVLWSKEELIARATGRGRLAVCRTAQWSMAEAETRGAIEGTISALRRSGASVEDIVLPSLFDDMPAVHQIANLYEAARCFAHECRFHRSLLSDSLRDSIARGFDIPEADYRRALALIEPARAAFADLAEGFDAVLTPAAVGTAPVGLTSTGDPVFCRTWSALRLPAICLPVARVGLPVGIQILGLPFTDAALLDTAETIEGMLRET